MPVATVILGVEGHFIVVAAVYAFITSAVIFCVFIVCLACEELSQSDKALHVLFTLFSPAQAPGVVTSAEVNVNELPQASVAVATGTESCRGQS